MLFLALKKVEIVKIVRKIFHSTPLGGFPSYLSTLFGKPCNELQILEALKGSGLGQGVLC